MVLATAFLGNNSIAGDFSSALQPGGLSTAVPNVKSGQDVVALAALTSPADQSSVYVEDELSWYHYDAQSTATPTSGSPTAGDAAVKPDDVTLPDPGRWLATAGGGGGPSSPSGSFSFNFGRDSKAATDIWLRREDGIPTNLTPFIAPFNCSIIAVGLKNTTGVVETWDAELYKNADITPGAPQVVNALMVASVTASDEYYETLGTAIDLAAGDILGVYMRGTTIDRPTISVVIIRR